MSDAPSMYEVGVDVGYVKKRLHDVEVSLGEVRSLTWGGDRDDLGMAKTVEVLSRVVFGKDKELGLKRTVEALYKEILNLKAAIKALQPPEESPALKKSK